MSHQQQPAQNLVAAAYNDIGTIKYNTEVNVSVENIKTSTTYTTLEAVPLQPSQTASYTQYITTAEPFQQLPSSYSYPKPQEIVVYPTSTQSSRTGEVRN